MTTMGKYRHLSRSATADGHFVIMAIDHRTNLQQALSKSKQASLTDAEFLQYKHLIMESLVPLSSGVLGDPGYALGQGIASGVLHGQLGLLSPVEVTDYDLHPSVRSMTYIPNWSVKKVKMMGGDGIKLLLPYNADSPSIGERLEVVEQIIADCTTYDIPFYLEPIPHTLDPNETMSNAEYLDISLEMCERFCSMGVDVLKMPFPVDAKQSSDETEWADACRQINDACTVPWALLSAGVTFDVFLRQSQIACESGASGVIVGRAVWSEAVALQGDDRVQFMKTTAASRMQQLAQVCSESATPWQARVQKPDHAVNWYETYQQ